MTADASRPRPVGAFPRRHLRIEPTRGLCALRTGLREMWEYRDLLLLLAGRDLKLRYRQTALGVLWVVIQPLLSSIIFAIVFGRVARLSSGGAPYLLFVYSAMLPWNLLAASLQRAGTSLIADARLISKVYFPRLLIPVASCTAVLLDFCISFAVMMALMAFYGVMPTARMLALPLFAAMTFAVAVGVSLGFSALTVYYRDFVHMLPFVLQVWMFASPLVYSSSMVPEEWWWLYSLNPLVGVMESFRWALLNTSSFPTATMGAALASIAVMFMAGMGIFGRVERSFADAI